MDNNKLVSYVLDRVDNLVDKNQLKEAITGETQVVPEWVKSLPYPLMWFGTKKYTSGVWLTDDELKKQIIDTAFMRIAVKHLDLHGDDLYKYIDDLYNKITTEYFITDDDIAGDIYGFYNHKTKEYWDPAKRAYMNRAEEILYRLRPRDFKALRTREQKSLENVPQSDLGDISVDKMVNGDIDDQAIWFAKGDWGLLHWFDAQPRDDRYKLIQYYRKHAKDDNVYCQALHTLGDLDYSKHVTFYKL